MTEPRGQGEPPRIAVLISFSGEGGVERMVSNLVEGFARAGQAVDLLLIRARSAHLRELPASVRVISLAKRHSLKSLFPLITYLRRERPKALLAAKDRAGRVAVLARALARVDTRVVVRLGTNLSAALKDQGWWRRWPRFLAMRLAYRWADAVVAVSEGVAADTIRITGLPRGRVRVVHNPVVTPALAEHAAAPCRHPWLGPRDHPVILAAGRLTTQKDFATLIRAFALARADRRCRLVILGEGRLRRALETLVEELGLTGDVDLPGFEPNPYPSMVAADLFVLSSAWEGSPNVLTEALALGTPVVATDCPSGPREILADGKVGLLVPVADPPALSRAILATLDHPPECEILQAAAADYSADASAAHYLDILAS
jgi:glycosyltransferase involved in cell wall biosynthesis